MTDNISADYVVENHGSLFLVRALKESATRHLREHTGEETQWIGTAVAVEPRYIEEFVAHLKDDGFTFV